MNDPSQKQQELLVYLSDKRKDKQREIKWQNNACWIAFVIAAICSENYKSAAIFFVVMGFYAAIEAASLRTALTYLDIEISKLYSRLK